MFYDGEKTEACDTQLIMRLLSLAYVMLARKRSIVKSWKSKLRGEPLRDLPQTCILQLKLAQAHVPDDKTPWRLPINTLSSNSILPIPHTCRLHGAATIGTHLNACYLCSMIDLVKPMKNYSLFSY